MTKEKQRIAIAETCFPDFMEAIEIDGRLMIHQGEISGCPLKQECPDYLNDLNAMHEAEKVLTEIEMIKYGELIQDTCHWWCVGIVPDYNRDLKSLAYLIHVTADQRAEAFLKTIGKWEES